MLMMQVEVQGDLCPRRHPCSSLVRVLTVESTVLIPDEISTLLEQSTHGIKGW